MNKYFFYYFPFLIFITTQVLLFIYFDKEKLLVPQFMGHHLHELTDINIKQCPFRIYKVSTNNEYTDNYIISQYPLPGAFIKPNQIVNIEVNKIETKKATHKLLKNSFFKDFITYSKKNNIVYKKISFDYINKDFKEKVFINTFDEKAKLNIIYTLTPNKKSFFYIPNFYGQICKDVFKKNNQYTLTCHCNQNIKNDIDKECQNKDCDLKIKIQYPLPGIYFLEDDKIKIHFWH